MATKNVITLGIGTDASIDTFVLFGLSVRQASTAQRAIAGAFGPYRASAAIGSAFSSRTALQAFGGHLGASVLADAPLGGHVGPRLAKGAIAGNRGKLND